MVCRAFFDLKFWTPTISSPPSTFLHLAVFTPFIQPSPKPKAHRLAPSQPIIHALMTTRTSKISLSTSFEKKLFTFLHFDTVNTLEHKSQSPSCPRTRIYLQAYTRKFLQKNPDKQLISSPSEIGNWVRWLFPNSPSRKTSDHFNLINLI